MSIAYVYAHCDSRFVRFEHKLFVLPRLEIDVFIKPDREMHHTFIVFVVIAPCSNHSSFALQRLDLFFRVVNSFIRFLYFIFLLSFCFGLLLSRSFSFISNITSTWCVLYVHDIFVLTKSLCKQQRARWSMLLVLYAQSFLHGTCT